MHYSSCRWLPVSLRQFVVIGCSSLTQFTYMHIVMHRLTRLHVSLNKISVQLCTVQSKQSAMAAATHRVRDGHPSITMGPGIGWYMHPAPQRNTRYVRMAECGGTYGLLVTHTSTLRETGDSPLLSAAPPHRILAIRMLPSLLVFTVAPYNMRVSQSVIISYNQL